MPRVVHFEIHAENTRRARKLDTTLFGWEFTAWGVPMEHWLIKDTEGNIFGIMQPDPSAI